MRHISRDGATEGDSRGGAHQHSQEAFQMPRPKIITESGCHTYFKNLARVPSPP